MTRQRRPSFKKNPIRVGVIGAGNMGQNHIRVFSQLDKVRLVSVSDVNQSLLKNITTRFPVRIYKNFIEMLDKEELDVVSIAVPTSLHLPVAKESLSRSIHSLIEKPLAPTVFDAKEIIKMAKKNNTKIGVGHVERFNPVVSALKKRLTKKKAGKIFQITVRRLGPFPTRIRDVGVILDLATHDIDLLYYLTQSEVKKLSIESANILNKKHEDMATSLIRFKNGIIGAMIENWLSPTKIRDLIINCEKGMFIADFLSQDLYFYENNYTPSSWGSMQIFRGMNEGNMTRYYIKKQEPLKIELEAFIESVCDNKPFLVSGEDGLRTIDIAQKLIFLSKHSSSFIRNK